MSFVRRAVWIAALAASVLVLAAPAAAQETELALTEAGGTRFPDRAFVLSLPSEMVLDGTAVEVRENGKLIRRVSLAAAGGASEGFAFVLVIDASASMRGEAIEGALAAARAFAEQRLPSQRVAIVTFNATSTVLLPFTTSQERIEAAVTSAPPLARETHLYDGVRTALGVMKGGEVLAGSIIVLSDGADTGSEISLADVAAEARAEHTRIFSVGLRGTKFAPDALGRLAESAGGTYSEARSADDLAPIFDALGARLANEYLLRYRSPAGPNEVVHVAVTVRGVDGFAAAEYRTAALADKPQGPFHRSFAERFLRSPSGMVAAGLGSALFLWVALMLLLRPRAKNLRARMSEFVSVPQPTEQSRRARTGSGAVLGTAERSFERTPWWSRFKEELELAEIKTPAVQIVLWTFVGTVFAMWLLATLGGSFVFALLGLAVPLVTRGYIKRKLARKRTAFGDQLPDNLQVLSSALRAGHSLVGALSVVVDDSPEPSRSEFRRVIADEQLGVNLEEAIGSVARRMASQDLDQVALVAALQQETGGNTAEVLDRVSETIRERFELRRMVKTLTTQGRMSRWIVSFLPVGLLGLITLLNPEYMAPLYTNMIGRIMLAVAAVMVIAGSLVIRRIVDIKV